MSTFTRGARSWAGGYITPTTTGTVTATAEESAGRVRLDVNWADAQYINVYRSESGVLSRVRDASPSSNPSGVQTVYDREAPLDTAVSYVVTTPWLAFASLTSNTVTLPSGARVWLTHPTRPELAMTVRISRAPERTHTIEQSVLRPIGRRYPVVVSAAIRQAPAQQLLVYTETLAERDQLLDLLETGSPLLLRTPSGYGWDALTWLSIGSVTEESETSYGGTPCRLWTLPTQQVDAPAIAGG